jgi:hypothetical protein
MAEFLYEVFSRLILGTLLTAVSLTPFVVSDLRRARTEPHEWQTAAISLMKPIPLLRLPLTVSRTGRASRSDQRGLIILP